MTEAGQKRKTEGYSKGRSHKMNGEVTPPVPSSYPVIFGLSDIRAEHRAI